jgi:hypothetical protein
MRYIYLLILINLFNNSLCAQSKAELEEKRKATLDEIVICLSQRQSKRQKA